MSISLQITKDQIASNEEAKVHFIPASVSGNGVIKIDEYFNNYTGEENGVLTNALRGYPLKGIEMKVPDSTKGFIFKEDEKLKAEDSDRVLKYAGKFDTFTYWNYDKNPSENDPYKKSLHYLKVAEALHSKVESLDE